MVICVVQDYKFKEDEHSKVYPGYGIMRIVGNLDESTFSGTPSSKWAGETKTGGLNSKLEGWEEVKTVGSCLS